MPPWSRPYSSMTPILSIGVLNGSLTRGMSVGRLWSSWSRKAWQAGLQVNAALTSRCSMLRHFSGAILNLAITKEVETGPWWITVCTQEGEPHNHSLSSFWSSCLMSRSQIWTKTLALVVKRKMLRQSHRMPKINSWRSLPLLESQSSQCFYLASGGRCLPTVGTLQVLCGRLCT